MTTKILALTDALGNLIRFRLMPGQRYDSVDVPPLIDGIDFDGLIADKAFDSNALIAELNNLGARIVISQHPARAQKLRIDAEIYIWRHLIENFFCSSRSSNALPCVLARPTGASKQWSTSLPPLSTHDESPQTLVSTAAGHCLFHHAFLGHAAYCLTCCCGLSCGRDCWHLPGTAQLLAAEFRLPAGPAAR